MYDGGTEKVRGDTTEFKGVALDVRWRKGERGGKTATERLTSLRIDHLKHYIRRPAATGPGPINLT